MNRIPSFGFAILLTLTLCDGLYAAVPSPYLCYGGSGNTRGGKMMVNGSTIEIAPEKFPDMEDEELFQCHATIRSPTGEIIYDRQEQSFDIDPVTGSDINADGEPDAVLIGYSGGAHCCYREDFIAIGKTPGAIAQLETQDSELAFEHLKRDARVYLVTNDSAFAYFHTDFASSPLPLVIARLDGAVLKELSSEFPDKYDPDIEKSRSELKNFDIEAYRRKDKAQKFEETHSIWSLSLRLVLDLLYSGRSQQARSAAEEFWPPKDVANLWGEVLNGYCVGKIGVALNRSKLPICQAGH